MLKKIWNVRSLKYVAAFLIPAILVMFVNQSLDDDSWYILAEGREIVQNGIYYTDPLSMHEGLNVTVQNYGFAALFYLLFSWLGASGIYITMLVLNFVVCFLIYKICMLISNKNVNVSLLIMMVTDMLLALGFVVTRAQMVSYVIFLAFIYVLELYIKTDKAKYLWWLPVLSVLQINLHASLWWMLVLVMIVYIIDAIRKPKLHLQGYRMKPLLFALIGVAMLGFANPYGFNMILFIMKSYGDTRFHNMVVELKQFSPFGGVPEFFIYLSLIGVLLSYIFGKKRHIRIRYLLMLFGFLALGLNTIKGLSQLILTMFFPLALVYKDVRVEKVIDAKIGRDAIMIWGGVICLAIFVTQCLVVTTSIKEYPSEILFNAVNAIDNEAKGKEDGANIYTSYTGYNDGGYVEYRGYKSYLDPRGEVFLEKMNKKEDILYEWDDFTKGRISINEMLERYNFDYIIARGREDDPFYDLDDERYGLIFEDEEKDEKVRVFKKK